MKKDFRVYLSDIIDSCDKIANYIHRKTKDDLENETELQDAVVRRLEIIGEAVKRLPEEFRNNHSEIAWRKAISMRNILIHMYDDIELDQVWDTIEKTLPPFKKQIQELLEQIS
jgi:uncharacterized protein with HEPN domain